MDIINDNYAYNRNNITEMSYVRIPPTPNPPPKNKQTKQKANKKTKKTEFTLLIFLF